MKRKGFFCLSPHLARNLTCLAVLLATCVPAAIYWITVPMPPMSIRPRNVPVHDLMLGLAVAGIILAIILFFGWDGPEGPPDDKPFDDDLVV